MKHSFLLFAFLLTNIGSFACSASFTTSPNPSNNDLLRILLTNSSSYGTVPGGYRQYTQIDFGDGTTKSFNGGVGSINHSYASSGTYAIKLVASVNDTLTGSVYCSDSTTNTITVAYPSCGTMVSHLNDTGGLVTFSATNPAGTTGLKYVWYFGDGGHDTGATVTHIYVGNGVYTITLADTSASGGCSYENSFNDTIASGTYYCDSIKPTLKDWGPGYPAFDNFVIEMNNPYPTLTAHTIFDYGDGTTGNMDSHMYPSYGKYVTKMETDWVDTFSHTVICRDTVIDTISEIKPLPYIAGTIYFDSAGPYLTNYDCKVWLISLDTVTHIVAAIDSMTASGGSYPYFAFRILYPTGVYLLKVKAIYDTSGYGYVPTYYSSELYWNTAQRLNYDAIKSFNTDVTMKHGTATSGPGFIGGNVLYGAGKTTGGPVGAPVEGLHVMLLNSSGKLIKQAYTDALGMYSFSNLPLGTYNVFPESLGYITTPASAINLTSSSPTDTGVSFKQNSTSIFPTYLGIDKLLPNATLKVYPNPNNGSFILIGDNSFADGLNITVTNVTGQVVYANNMRNMTYSHVFDLSFLPAGAYFINIRTSKVNQMIKMDIVH